MLAGSWTRQAVGLLWSGVEGASVYLAGGWGQCSGDPSPLVGTQPGTGASPLVCRVMSWGLWQSPRFQSWYWITRVGPVPWHIWCGGGLWCLKLVLTPGSGAGSPGCHWGDQHVLGAVVGLLVVSRPGTVGPRAGAGPRWVSWFLPSAGCRDVVVLGPVSICWWVGPEPMMSWGCCLLVGGARSWDLWIHVGSRSCSVPAHWCLGCVLGSNAQGHIQG